MERVVTYAPALILSVAVLVLAAVLGAQYVGGLAPCPLCIAQRVPWVGAAALGLAALATTAADSRRALVILAAAVLALGAGLGTYHAGIEYGWFAGPGSCTSQAGNARSIEELRALVLGAPLVPCDQVPWSLFGISLAGYNALASAALAACAWGAARYRDRATSA